jgi:UDP-glucose 4-epimerase
MVAQYYEAHENLQGKPNLVFHQVDFRDMKAMMNVLQAYHSPDGRASDSGGSEDRLTSCITGVIHFAAYKAVGESIKLPLKYYSNSESKANSSVVEPILTEKRLRIDVGGLIDFLALLNDFGIRKLVFSSSATVYGNVADQGQPLREEHCSQKKAVYIDSDGSERTVESGCSGLTNPYGRTKWMCEAILSDLCCSDLAWEVTALRYFNPVGCDESGVLGEDPRGAASNLMPGMFPKPPPLKYKHS